MPPKKRGAPRKGSKAAAKKNKEPQDNQEQEDVSNDQNDSQKVDLSQEEPQTTKKAKLNKDQENQVNLEKKQEQQIEVVILDIEGTTTPITFVTDVLFPYAMKQMKNYIIENYTDQELQKDLRELMTEAKIQKNIDISEFPTSKYELYKQSNDFLSKILDFIDFLMSENQKVTALKNIQGKIWKSAYENQEIKGVVYDEVKEQIEKWIKDKKKVYIYSSGSVEAQKLLFQYSNLGNMLSLFSGHFDTKIGIKTEKNSYENIVKEINVKAEKCCFITDRYVEAVAAEQAGIHCILSVREGTEKLPENNKFKTITSFDLIDI